MSIAPRETKCELLDRLRRADQLAGAAPARVSLPVFSLISRVAGRAADGADLRELVGHRVGGALVDHHADDLRDDVAGPLDHHRVADADVVAFADRLAEAVKALDVVLVVQRDVSTTTPPTVTGASRATGASVPVRPTWISILRTVVVACSAGNLWAIAQRGSP